MRSLRFLTLTLPAAVAVWAFSAPAMAAPQCPAFDKKSKQPAARVGVNRVVKGPMQQTVAVIGRFVAREGGVIAARTAGPVDAIKVHVGDRVTKGQVLAVLVSETIQARMRLQAAELRLAEQELKRLDRLRVRKSAAFAQARYEDAQQRVVKAKANLRIAALALEYSQIRAPFPGVVTKRHTDAGAFLKLGDPVVTLINDGNLEIEADVPSNRVAGLKAGSIITFALATGAKRKARVRAVIPEENPMTRTRAVRVRPVENGKAGKFAMGQSVTLDIPRGPKIVAISVHKDAIVFMGARRLVYVAQRCRAMIRPVKLGPAIGDRFQVRFGLRPGELTIVRGNERVRPGQPITFRPPSPNGS